MTRPRIFDRSDLFLGALVFLTSFALYAYTTAPNVTLLDSGEFLVAATHFGVPHPPGYPLWTLLSFLFHLLPLGNAAWEIALFSGFCTAIGMGLATALSSSMVQWMGVWGDSRSGFIARSCICFGFGMMAAVSESVWSQAVIAEVYGLHTMLTAVFLTLLYAWARQPQRDGLMFGAFFVLALSFSNHHLTLTESPLPFVLLLLLRRRAFLDWLLAALITALLGYLLFALLSHDISVLKTATRLFYCIFTAAAIYVWIRRFRIRWKLIAFLPIVVFAGLTPYLYMPFASSTNPPMNWSYTRDADGFYAAFNRTQYSGSLSEVTVKIFGRLVGTAPTVTPDPKRDQSNPRGLAEMMQDWSRFYWGKLIEGFTPFCLVGYFAALFAAMRGLKLAQRSWIYFLYLSFVLAAYFEAVVDGTEIDLNGWWLQMPFLGFANMIFAIISAFGTCFVVGALMRRRNIYFWIAPVVMLGPLITAPSSYGPSNQRGRWFGWMFGHDMLKDLPRGSVVIGGTDPGRFIPTYMIFSESKEPARFKRDPSFDRSDLYIITQNALGEKNYMKYLRDQYTPERPPPKNAFEHWLDRDNAFPKEPLVMPSEDEVNAMVLAAATEAGGAENFLKDDPSAAFSVVLRWIWERNRDKHDFFIEESFPMKWTYDYAVPEGLIYRMNKTKLDQLPQDVVNRDFAFWRDYKARLEADPQFHLDLDAQRSFAKLRITMANIYRYRKMYPEAIRAYLEALELSPTSIEALVPVCNLLWDRGEFDATIELTDRALNIDYNSRDILRMRILSEERQKADGEIRETLAKLERQPRSRDLLTKLLQIYNRIGDKTKADETAERALKALPDDTDMLRTLVSFYVDTGELRGTLAPALRLTALESSNAQNLLILTRAYFANDKKKEFYETASKAIEAGGLNYRDIITDDPLFAPWKEDPEFKKLDSEDPSLTPQPAPTPQPVVAPQPAASPLPATAPQPQPAATSSTGRQEQKTLRSP